MPQFFLHAVDTMNSSGLRIEPCEMPDSTGNQSEKAPCNATL